MKIGNEVYVHGYVDEIRNDVVIIRNDGGYFGTVEDEVICFKAKFHKEHIEPNVVIEPTQVVMPKKCKGCDSASKIIEAYSKRKKSLKTLTAESRWARKKWNAR